MNVYRQGDIALIEVEALPEDAAMVSAAGARIILARGEATGHTHRFEPGGQASLHQGRYTGDDAAESWLVVGSNSEALLHEEHATLMVPRGVYRVARQRQFDAGHVSLVRD